MGLIRLATESTDLVPWKAIAVLSVGCLVSIFNYWRFRSGWKMTGPRWEGYPFKDLVIRVGYASLPSAAFCMFGALMMLFTKLSIQSSSPYWVVAALFSGGLMVLAGTLAFKEAASPSDWNRTPSWMSEKSGD